MATSIVARQCLIHTHESITPFGLQIFFIPTIKILLQYYNSNPFNPTLTSLEEEMVALFIAKIGNLAQGGTIPKERENGAACGVNLSLI